MNDQDPSVWIDDEHLSATENFTDITIISDSTEGFCQVYKARKGGKWHILKTLKSKFADNPIYQEMLRKEFDIGYSLDHQNICKTLGMENVPGVGICIVQEYIDGCTLSDLLKQGNISLKTRKKIINELCEALIYVHHKQIVHRDLKPDNIMVTFNGYNVKLIDFGLADTDDYCSLKAPAGTKTYASPEQRNGQTLDCRSDIYSLGLLIDDILPRYERVVSKCTRINREERYQTVEDVEKAIRHNYLHTLAWIGTASLSCFICLILIHLLFPTESLFIDNNVIDLSANNHFANCYVVNKPGHYSFAPCKLDGTLVHGDLAFWVWQEPNVIIDSLNYDNNNISFFVKDIGNGGNALIQLRDGHENPIWCWHIWITPNSTDQMTVQLKGGDWLACNLGASFLPKDDLKKMQKISDSQLYRTYGLYYQNGIPIPFIGGNYKGMNDVNYTNAFSQICVTNYRKGLYQAFKMTHEDPKTIEEAMSVPFISYSPTQLDFAWNRNGSTSAWGGKVLPDTLCALEHGHKTIYDPCPYGYRVPTMTELYQDLNPNSSLTKEKYSTLVSPTVCGTQAKILLNNGHYVMLPAAGHQMMGTDNVTTFMCNLGFDGYYMTSDLYYDKDWKIFRQFSCYLYKRFFTDYFIDYSVLQSIRCIKDNK